MLAHVPGTVLEHFNLSAVAGKLVTVAAPVCIISCFAHASDGKDDDGGGTIGNRVSDSNAVDDGDKLGSGGKVLATATATCLILIIRVIHWHNLTSLI